MLILILPLCSRCSTFRWVPADGERVAASLWSSDIDGSIDQIWVTDLQLLPAGSGARGAGMNIRAEAAAQRQSDTRAPSIRNRLKGFTSKISNLYPRKRRARRIGIADIQTSPNVPKESGNGTISCKIGLFFCIIHFLYVWQEANACFHLETCTGCKYHRINTSIMNQCSLRDGLHHYNYWVHFWLVDKDTNSFRPPPPENMHV